MSQLLAINDKDQLLDLTYCDDLSAAEYDNLSRHNPDALWIVIEQKRIVAHCALWWRKVPALPHQRAGIIGCYAARDEASGLKLLDYACRELALQGCTLAVGPMDGNTWHRYRFITERGEKPSFFLEPDNADQWPQHFIEAGFTPLAFYSSILCTDPTREDPRIPAVAARLAATGTTLRSLRMENVRKELQAIYAACIRSFHNNFLYSPITEDEFVEQYAAVLPFVRPDLVLLAEREGQLVGFSFAVPDVLQAQRGRKIDTVILKTVAVLPGRNYAGLGNLLTVRTHTIARDMGFTRVIHALMHEDNASRIISEYYGHPMRRYALYSRPLQQDMQ